MYRAVTIRAMRHRRRGIRDFMRESSSRRGLPGSGSEKRLFASASSRELFISLSNSAAGQPRDTPKQAERGSRRGGEAKRRTKSARREGKEEYYRILTIIRIRIVSERVTRARLSNRRFPGLL